MRPKSKPSSKPLKFIATIYRIWMMRHVDVPQEVSEALAKAYGAATPKLRGSRQPKYIPVVAVVNGRSARASKSSPPCAKRPKRTRATPWPSSCASIGNREAFPFRRTCRLP
jgi:hypothetical protein